MPFIFFGATTFVVFHLRFQTPLILLYSSYFRDFPEVDFAILQQAAVFTVYGFGWLMRRFKLFWVVYFVVPSLVVIVRRMHVCLLPDGFGGLLAVVGHLQVRERRAVEFKERRPF